jgi:hypothetical protein
MEESGAIFGRYKNVYPEFRYPAVLFKPHVSPTYKPSREMEIDWAILVGTGKYTRSLNTRRFYVVFFPRAFSAAYKLEGNIQWALW